MPGRSEDGPSTARITGSAAVLNLMRRNDTWTDGTTNQLVKLERVGGTHRGRY